jgi:hydroxyethylthiazole kinase-like uncharacterized protein yjeF
MMSPAIPVYTSDEIRAIERQAAESATPPLMERAGLAVARLAQELVLEKQKRILVVAGPGNNGGDAFVAARHLKRWWYDVKVAFAGEPGSLPDDAKAAFEAWRQAGGESLQAWPERWQADLVLDGLFGMGLRRPLEGLHAALVGKMNTSGATVLAIDVPSGLHADTGAMLGTAVHAHHTLTFIGLKPGLLTLDGPDCAGDVHLDDLDLDFPAGPEPGGWVIPDTIVGDALAPRRRNSHKGSFGAVGILGGTRGMAGAALLAGRAALKLGAGKVYVGLLADELALDPVQPELMLRPAEDVLAMKDLACVACGPGLGQRHSASHLLSRLLGHPSPLVLDADALNLLATSVELQDRLRNRGIPVLLTPHPAEAARLLGRTTPDIQADRIAAALEVAARFHASVVLKGNGSVCAFANGDWFINTSGNPGMASAGVGDVLTGMLAALLAQGVAPNLALLAGVHLHGAAADRLAESGIGPVGMTASEVIDAARACLNAPSR